MVGHAARDGKRDRAAIETLNGVVGQIGAVADSIRDIAARTNLLALDHIEAPGPAKQAKASRSWRAR